MRTPAISAFLVLTAGLAGITGAQSNAPVCLLGLEFEYDRCLEESDAIAACSKALSETPQNFPARASLCEAHVTNGDYEAASAVIREGKTVHKGDRATVQLLDRVLSNVAEAQRPGRTAPQRSTLVEYAVLRCTTLKNLEDCNEAIALDPENHQALTQRGNILAANGDVMAAIVSYRQSLAVEPDQPAAVEGLTVAMSHRQAEVQKCLASTRTAEIELCRSLLIAGESDAHDLYSKIGRLELQAGNLQRAQAAYESANEVRETRESGEMIGILTGARRCLGSGNGASCRATLETVPKTEMFRPLRAEVSFRACRGLADAAADVTEIETVCAQARASNTNESVIAEIDRAVATVSRGASGPIVSQTPPVQRTPRLIEQAPERSLTRQCKERAATSAAARDVIALCERAQQAETGEAELAVLAGILAQARARQESALAMARCEDAQQSQPPRQALETCRRVPTDALEPSARKQWETVTAALEDRTADERRVAATRARCIRFDETALAEAREDCREVLKRLPDDREVIAAAGRVEDLIAAYVNEPLVLSQGHEAITY